MGLAIGIGNGILFTSQTSIRGVIPDFITTWKTTVSNETITIGLDSAQTYNFTVDWGDNSQETITSGNDLSHTYSNPGNYLVKINGTFPRIFMARPNATPDNLISINNWGNIQWQKMGGAFRSCSYLGNSSAEFPPILTNVDSFINIFFDAGTSSNLLINYINQWDVSSVTDMGSAFRNSTFNQNLSSWDVSSVTDMYGMFWYATSFNGDLSSWDVSSVTNMSNMFRDASSFNGDIGSWDVSSVDNMNYMFDGASAFNQDIGSWDVNGLNSTLSMFRDATAFNQDIGGWDVSNVTKMTGMLKGAITFNKNLSSWDVSSVTNMVNIFSNATSFNQNLSSWDVSNVTDMRFMFSNATSFNQPIGDWDVSNVTDMRFMFNIDTIVAPSGNFDQDISSWDILKVSDLFNFLRNQKLSTTNYDKLLIGWEATLQAAYPNGSGYPHLGTGVTANFGNSEYTGNSAASAARLSLDNNYNWTIIDGGTA